MVQGLDKVFKRLDINGDGLEDRIYQLVGGDIRAQLADPQKPDNWLEMAKVTRGDGPLFSSSVQEYIYGGDAYSRETDPIRVTAANKMGYTIFGMGDIVKYKRDCGRTEESNCTGTGKIEGFSFMIDLSAGRVVQSGVYFADSHTVVPFGQLSLLQSVPEMMEAADELSKILKKDMGKSLQRYDEILGYAPRECLKKRYQKELDQIENAAMYKLCALIIASGYVLWSYDARDYVVDKVMDKLFPPQED